MVLVIFLAIIAFADAHTVEPLCDDVLVHNIHHMKEVIVENKDSPYQLAMDYDTHTLFFSYTNKGSDDMFSSAYVNLKTNEFNTIPGISGGFANGVDNKRHIVYLGGSNGLYTFDFDTKTAKHIDGTHHSIWQMFFKNYLYYTTYPGEEVYVFKNGKTERVPELANTKAMLVALNKNLDLYFTNSSGLFKLVKSTGEIKYFDNYIANALTADSGGYIYFSTPDGVYGMTENDNINRLTAIENTYGVAIDSDGSIIYASENSIIRLKPTKTPCYVNEKKINENNQL